MDPNYVQDMSEDLNAPHEELEAVKGESGKDPEAVNEKSTDLVEGLKATARELEEKLEAERKERKKFEAESAALRARLQVKDGTIQMTKGEWLGRTLPRLTVINKSGCSTHGKYDFYTPKSVRSWDNFLLESIGYEKEVTVSGVSPRPDVVIHSAETGKIDSLGDAQGIVYLALTYLACSQYGWSISSPVRSKSDQGVLTEGVSGDTLAHDYTETPKSFEPDMVVMLGKRDILPIEIKAPGALRGEGDEAVNLVQSYSNPSCAKARHHCDCIRQLLSYMVQLKKRYGVLSSAECTYFVRRVRQNENDNDYSSIEISTAVMFHSAEPTLLEALYYILDKSTTDLSLAEEFRFERGVAPEYDEDAGEDRTPKKKSRRTKPDKTYTAGTRRSLRLAKKPVKTYHDMQDTESSDLHLQIKPLSSGGWSGKIAIGFVNGQQVVIKLAKKDSKEAEALFKEITAYEMLQRYWGKYVPELVKYGTTVNGSLVFVAIKFLRGLEMSKKTPSQAERRSAEEALNAIHLSGLVHGDVHGGNIMVVDGMAQFIDFGFSRFVKNQAECTKELDQLKQVLQENCISTVTQS